jgi:hypothetical protein
VQILVPGYYQKVVSELDGWKAVGAKAATLQITYPILDPAFDPWGGQSAKFLAFYKQVVADIRSRGMKVIVENTPTLSDPSLSQVNVLPFYQSLTDQQYEQGRANHVLIAAQQLSPDYMSVIEEPDTEALNTQKPKFGTPQGSLQLLQTVLSTYNTFRVRRQQANSTAPLLGAGVGIWLNNYSDFLNGFVTTAVNYIDIHVYPINFDYLSRILTAGGIASLGKKNIGITEAWDYKIRDSEVGVISPAVAYARDYFSFWAPIDTAFLDALIHFSFYKKLVFLSPFWGQYMRGYLDYSDQTKNLNPTQLANLEALNVTNNVILGFYTTTGHDYHDQILSPPDTTPPTSPTLTAGSVSSNSVSFAWTLANDNIGVSGYSVYRDSGFLKNYLLQPYTDTTVADGKTYNYTVTAFDVAGNVSQPSAPLTITTPDVTPPTAPAPPTFTVTGPVSVNLTWGPATDNVGVSSYNVYRGPSSRSLLLVGSSPTNSFSDTVPTTGATYCYATRALDPAGNLSTSSGASCVLVTNPCATDVSAMVSITRGGLRFNNSTQQFVQTLTLVNSSSSSITGPVSVVLDRLSSSAALAGSSGVTTCQAPSGSPYMNVDAGADGTLSPGETLTVNLQFNDPSLGAISYATRLLAGGGTR